MRRIAAWPALAAMVGATVVAFLAPLPLAFALAVASVLGMRSRRLGFLAFAAVTVAINALLFAVLVPGDGPLQWGPLAFGREGAMRGLAGGLRVSAVLGANLAILSWMPAGRMLDGLGLPKRASAILGAVVLSAHDLGRDAGRLVDAFRLDGAWPRRRLARAAASARLLPALTVLALRRARIRAEALRLAGHDTGRSFAPLVAMTALAVAGRLALVAVPNVSLTYAVVFAAGLLFGARVGVASALLSMALTDLMLSGAYLVAFANAPAMALLGLLGASLRNVDFTGTGRADRWAGRLLAATCGVLAVLLFSLAVDTLTWLVVPEYRSEPGALRALVVAGLAFNAIPAAVNAVLFAAAVGPVTLAARQAGLLGTPLQRDARAATAA